MFAGQSLLVRIHTKRTMPSAEQTSDLLPPQPCSSSTRRTGRTPSISKCPCRNNDTATFSRLKSIPPKIWLRRVVVFLPPLTQRYIFVAGKNMLISVYDDMGGNTMKNSRYIFVKTCKNGADFTHPLRNSLITQCGVSPLGFKTSATGFA